jgi:hypothetical protein
MLAVFTLCVCCALSEGNPPPRPKSSSYWEKRDLHVVLMTYNRAEGVNNVLAALRQQHPQAKKMHVVVTQVRSLVPQGAKLAPVHSVSFIGTVISCAVV